MSALLLALLTSASVGAPLAPDEAVELSFAGTLTQTTREGDTVAKRFTLLCLLSPDDEGRRLSFLVDERGGGGWAWPERYGAIRLDGETAPGIEPIQLLQEHNGTPSPVPLRLPWFTEHEELAEGAAWRTGPWQYQVERRERIGTRDCWRIEATSSTGRAQHVWVEEGSPLVVAAERRVFLGQGDEFLLRYELETSRTLTTEERAAREQPLATLLALQAELRRPPGTIAPELTDDQLKLASDALPLLETQSEGTPFSRLVAVIARDVQSQSQRAGEVARLEAKFVGQKPEDWTLTSLDGRPVPPADYAQQIVVLHFWEYQGEPLAEPYGQVGYLDFLHLRRQKLGVKVYGVAVDPRFGKSEQAVAASRSVRKLQQFMNLSYPLLADDGTLIGRFGDPRQFGAALPLWVVIGPDGTVAHYKAGLYQVDPNEGLRQLDETLVKLIREAAPLP